MARKRVVRGSLLQMQLAAPGVQATSIALIVEVVQVEFIRPLTDHGVKGLHRGHRVGEVNARPHARRPACV